MKLWISFSHFIVEFQTPYSGTFNLIWKVLRPSKLEKKKNVEPLEHVCIPVWAIIKFSLLCPTSTSRQVGIYLAWQHLQLHVYLDVFILPFKGLLLIFFFCYILFLVIFFPHQSVCLLLWLHWNFGFVGLNGFEAKSQGHCYYKTNFEAKDF